MIDQKRPRKQTPLEREIRKVAFVEDLNLSDATRVVFHNWAAKMRGVDIRDAFDYVFGSDEDDNDN